MISVMAMGVRRLEGPGGSIDCARLAQTIGHTTHKRAIPTRVANRCAGRVPGLHENSIDSFNLLDQWENASRASARQVNLTYEVPRCVSCAKGTVRFSELVAANSSALVSLT